MDVADAARVVAADHLDIAIDLNGLTEGSGLNVLAARVAPVQGTFLGYVAPLNVPYVDFIISDAIVTPPEQASCLTEKLVRI